MTTLHTFGCSITQGFALPDVVKPVCDSSGRPLTADEIREQRIEFQWEDIHLYQPSEYAWPAVLGSRLGIPVQNHARRGACFQQIARQCAVEAKNILPTDTVIVMWTYLSRISLQWPARTSVPLANMVDPDSAWRTRILPGFNRFFGLSHSDQHADQYIYQYIHTLLNSHLDPMGVYDQYYRSLILQIMTAGFLDNTGARVIHLSVEPQSYLSQLDTARSQLPPSLRDPYVIPHPDSWYDISVDHESSRILHDPSIPPAENDMHPSVLHHSRFADHIWNRYLA
jgi:hypothetical protein